MKKIIKILLLVLAFAPLINDSSVFFPTSAGKIFFVRLILTLASILFLSSFIYSKNFRDEVLKRVGAFFRHPLALSIFAFFFIFAVSTLFAVDTYTAFWGDVQRGEGLVGMVFFLALFMFSLLIFEKEDWLWFFKLSLLTSIILLSKEFFDFLSGIERPGSYVGNPTFLAGYFLLSIFASIFVLSEESNKFWKYLSVIILFLSFLGIFITETRGAILGLVLGGILVFVYGALKGKRIVYKSITFQKISIAILGFFVVFATLFFVTKNGEFWRKIPGLARVATISSEDISTRTRLFSLKSSLASVDPDKNSWKETLVGWGPNNFILAFGKYYNQEQYRYEIEWFDRAHSKPLDALVMNGIFGLLAYLAIWIFYFKYILRRHDFSWGTSGFIFFGASFFIHLLFVFDHISTSVPFFIILAFIVYLSSPSGFQEESGKIVKSKRAKEIVTGAIFSILTLFICYIFVRGDMTAYIQMKKYLALKNTADSEVMVSKIDSIFEPFTIAQLPIRQDFLVRYLIDRDTTEEPLSKLLTTAFSKVEDYIDRMPYDFRFIGSVAGVYSMKGKQTNDTLLIKKGEEYFRRALTFIPNRPDFKYGLALNLAYQKKYNEAFEVLNEVIETDSELADSYYYYGFVFYFQGEQNYNESLDYFEKSLNIKSDLLLKNEQDVKDIYSNFVKYFYETKDKVRFLESAKRLRENDPTRRDALGAILQYLESQGMWPRIEFK